MFRRAKHAYLALKPELQYAQWYAAQSAGIVARRFELTLLISFLN
jgi:hypothetical protein